jgi:hypothetical protein
VDQAEEQDGSGFLSFSCSNKLKTNEGCVIDLNSKINRICYYFFHTPFTILLHDFISDSFVVTPVFTLPSPCNLLFVCNIPSNVYALFEGPSTVCHEMWVFAC